MKPCGTHAAYNRHLYRGETPCDPCRAAEADRKRAHAHRNGVKPRDAERPHGTVARYQKGCRCDGCREANADRVRLWRQGRPVSRQLANEPAYKLRDKILDILEIDYGWWTPHGLAERLDANWESVKRILRVLRDEGVVESRQVTLAMARPGQAGGMDARSEWRLA